MQIKRIETIIVKVSGRGDWVFVLVHTNDGLTGLGEVSHSQNDALVVEAVKQMDEQLKGQEIGSIRALWNLINRSHFGHLEQTAVSGIEQALWDLQGRKLNVPIHTLLGGALRKKLLLYANINRHVEDRTPDGFAQAAETAVSQGFKALKIAPFDELNSWTRRKTGTYAYWRPGVKRVQAVRRAIGPDIELAVDCHNRLDVAEAMMVAEAMKEFDLFWLEEPVSDRFSEQLADISRRVPMPTASGENLFAVEGFRELILNRSVDVIMPDVKHVGGISELCRVAESARINQIMVSPHNPAGPVATAASGHAASTLSNFYMLEYAWGEVNWRAKLLIPPERIEDGYLILPEGPGVGHVLNPEYVEKHRR